MATDLTRTIVQEGEVPVLSGEPVEWPLRCPNCGSERGGLLGNAHDFINDCPQCRTGVTGPTGPGQFGITGARHSIMGADEQRRTFAKFVNSRSRRGRKR